MSEPDGVAALGAPSSPPTWSSSKRGGGTSHGAEAQKRLAQYGPNEIEESRKHYRKLLADHVAELSLWAVGIFRREPA